MSQMDKNAQVLGDITVRELDEYVDGMTVEEKDKIEVLIGTPENIMGGIESGLDAVGLHNYVRINSMKWADMQERAFIKNGSFTPLSSYPIGCRVPDIEVWKMIHHKDKELKTRYTFPEYIKNLQVGAANTDEIVTEFTDVQGDNISDRNGNYSELTGLYWMWKNRIQKEPKNEKKYYGLDHYRRLLELSEDDQRRLISNDIDAVLPYPMPYEPDIKVHHKRYLTDKEWSSVIQALEELQPLYARAFTDVLVQRYFYNYNIVIARQRVIDDYCSWIFPLLFRIEEINNPDGKKEPNSYIGYV